MSSLEDAPDLFELPESDEDREGYRIGSLGELAWAMRLVAGKRRRRLEVATVAQAEIDRIQEWAAREDARWSRDAAFLESLVAEYALTHRTDREKSFTTPYGVVKTREQGGQWDIDSEAALPFLSVWFPHLVKTVESVKVADAKRAFEVAGGEVCDPVSGVAVPGIKVGEPTITAKVDVDLGLLADDEGDRWIVDQLRDAYDDLMAAPEGQRGECLDNLVPVVAALLDETGEAQR